MTAQEREQLAKVNEGLIVLNDRVWQMERALPPGESALREAWVGLCNERDRVAGLVTQMVQAPAEQVLAVETVSVAEPLAKP